MNVVRWRDSVTIKIVWHEYGAPLCGPSARKGASLWILCVKQINKITKGCSQPYIHYIGKTKLLLLIFCCFCCCCCCWDQSLLTSRLLWFVISIFSFLVDVNGSCLAQPHQLLGSRDGAVVRALASRTRRHMWVEFIVGSRPCSERLFPRYSSFPLCSKTNMFKFPFDLGGVPDFDT